MEVSEIITPLLCAISPFAIGWLLLSLAIGIRAGLEAGSRLFLLGLGLLSLLIAVGVILFFLPDWAAAVLILVFGFIPWVAALRYFVAIKTSGRLLMTLPFQQDKWRTSILAGVLPLVFGLQALLNAGDFLTLAKDYAIGATLISLGVFRMIQRVRCTQIREKGILYESGDFYEWGNIESYIWNFGEDKLSLRLRKFSLKQIVNLKILSQFRHEVITYLSKNIVVDIENQTDGHIGIQKVG